MDPKTRMMRDADGAAVIFHGVNVVYKVDPYIPSSGDFDPQDSLNDKDIADLKKWGMNFVRLGVMWEAVERTAGVYDDDYLTKVEALINKLGEAGIYTLVDMHQDVLARYMCGEGMPNFYAKEVIGAHPHCRSAVQDKLLKKFYDMVGLCKSVQKDYHYEKDENGDPLISECQKNDFAFYYTSPEALNAFDALYNNKQGL
jgi:endoglycosylceramidase